MYKVYNADTINPEVDALENSTDVEVMENALKMMREMKESYKELSEKYNQLAEDSVSMKKYYENQLDTYNDLVWRHVNSKEDLKTELKIKEEFILQTKQRRNEYPAFLEKLKTRSRWEYLDEDIEAEQIRIADKITKRERRNG
ncbi:MAG TPA: hypothetical protein VEY70_19635 [Metabacillus sp.]|nr:hypothetical protein [Metabacillus sp.]